MKVYCIADNIISPLGNTSKDNFEEVKAGKARVQQVSNPRLMPVPFFASSMKATLNDGLDGYTRFERLCIASISDAMKSTPVNLANGDTILILSTTKGNIELIKSAVMDETIIAQVSLAKTATKIGKHFKAKHTPIVVSNACISGVLALIVAKRLLLTKQYKNAVVVGADILSQFVVSGFQSLMAMSDEPCRPFDRDRKGINLGEGAATIVLTTDEQMTDSNSALIIGEGLSNDANHISGPSRTGAELAHAVQLAMAGSGVGPSELSFVSAHGTATIYNDEMESKAFEIAGLTAVPLHSLKGYYGHTLGAAGLIESVLCIHSLRNNVVLASKNYEVNGVPIPLNINIEVVRSTKFYALKTASGFGGCNAAVVFSKKG